ncbi:N-acetyltransferase [Mesorhizobium sp.]|nr:N-acetyltransferase [Mesorhizobium sp.]
MAARSASDWYARPVEDARREGVAIIPLCPFAKAQIDRHVEWQDVLRRS